MTARSHYRGHPIYFDDASQVWRYVDDDTATADPAEERPCGKCNEKRTEDEHDPCIANLPGGVMNACCGHGSDREAYVQFWDGRWVGGHDAVRCIEQLRAS